MTNPNGGQQWGAPQGGPQGQPQQWGTPQGQPQQQTWGQAAQTGFQNASAGSGFDVKTVPWWQWTIIGGWLVYFIGLFLPHLTASSDSSSPYGAGYSDSVNGFHYGLHTFAFILVTLAVIAIIASWFMKPQLSGLPFPFGFVTGGLAALGALLGIIAFIVNLTDSDSAYGFSVGPGFGTWITLIALLAIAAGAAFEIMDALKQPKNPSAGAGQWGQPAAGQWGAPQGDAGQWGAPQTGGQALPPQQPASGQWGQPGPQTGGQPLPPQNPGQQPGQGQWGQ